MKSGCLKPPIYFERVSRYCISILHGLPRLGRFSRIHLPSTTHAPADDRRFDRAGSFHIVPSTATPSAQKRDDISADVILAKKFKRLVRRGHTFVSEGADSFLPCRHAVLIIAVVTNSRRIYGGAAMLSRRAYMTPIRAYSTARTQWHLSQITDEIEPSERGRRALGARRNSERRTRKLRSAKPSTLKPSRRRMKPILHRRKSKADA